MANILQLLVFFGIIVTLFFIFRELNLSYWKIDILIKNQERQNYLLEKILFQLGYKLNDAGGKLKKTDMVNKYGEDQPDIESLIKILKSDELILKVKYSGRFEIVKKADWNEIMKNGNQEKFDLIFLN